MSTGRRDPGLALERTAMAWQRTGISAAMVGAGATLLAVRIGDLPLVAASAGVTAAAAAGASWAAYGSTPGARAEPAASPWPHVLFGAFTVVALACLGVAMALSS